MCDERRCGPYRLDIAYRKELSMTTKVGINGFGRIGRLAFRAMVKDPELEVSA